MYVIHSHLTFDPADGPGFEQQAVESRANDGIQGAPGFVRRLLLRDETHPGEYVYVSAWTTPEQHHAYQRGRMEQLANETAARELEGLPPAPRPTMVRSETTLLFEDAAADLGAATGG